MIPPSVAHLLDLIRLGAGPTASGSDGEATPDLGPLVEYERIGAWVWHRLRQTGWQAQLSAEEQARLRANALEQAAVRLKLAAVTARVVSRLADRGIRPVLLKGAAYSALADRYRYFRFRPAVDVDLLVEPGSGERAWRHLEEAGLPRADAGPSVHPDHHHLPTLVGDFQVPVEVHSSASLFWSAEDSWDRLAGTAQEVVWQGVPVLVPAPTELMWHAVVHSLGDGASGCRLRNFLTVAALLHNGGEVNWDLIGARIEAEPVHEHDSRQRVRPMALKRWLGVAAWLGRAKLPSGLEDAQPVDLARLVEFRRRRLARWCDTGNLPSTAERWMQEAARAELGFGPGRLPHWLPRRFRPRRMIASVVYQWLYRAAR